MTSITVWKKDLRWNPVKFRHEVHGTKFVVVFGKHPVLKYNEKVVASSKMFKSQDDDHIIWKLN